MEVTRRDFMTAASALAAAFGCRNLPEACAAATSGPPPVVWLQAQTCSGCSVSLLNSICLLSAADLLTKTISLSYHSTLMSAYGSDAIAVAKAAQETTGFVLVVEGAIPTLNQGKQCYLWPGTTALQGVKDFASKAGFVIAVGTCAAYGGVAAGAPNPTQAQLAGSGGRARRGSSTFRVARRIPTGSSGRSLISLKYGQAPALDSKSPAADVLPDHGALDMPVSRG